MSKVMVDKPGEWSNIPGKTLFLRAPHITQLMNQSRGRVHFFSWLFVAIILQTFLWPVLVSSESAFETLPYHSHLYLRLDGHTRHEVSAGDTTPTFAIAGIPWTKAIRAGALCQVTLIASYFAGILIPESLSSLVSALGHNLFLLPQTVAEQFVTALFFPPPDQPPRF